MAIKSKPKVVAVDKTDDVQAIGSVEQMYNKFVRNIDSFRSLANAPGLGTSGTGRFDNLEDETKRNLLNLDVSADKLIESRAHAFYRMVGFPVATESGYYNSGHDPEQSESSSTNNRTNINKDLNTKYQNLITLSKLRETQFKDRVNVFAKQNEVSTIYALLMRFPKPFLMAKTELTPFVADNQITSIDKRSVEITNLNTTENIPKFINTDVSHILKPFIVIPEIEMAVTENYKRRICVPFLPDKASTKSTPDFPLKRPIIEYIIHKRLQVSTDSSTYMEQILSPLKNQINQDPGTVNSFTNLLSALSGEADPNKITTKIIDEIQDFTSVQGSTVLMFTNAIKVAVDALSESIKEFDKLRIENGIQPVPAMGGPEFYGSIKTIGGVSAISQNAQKIAELKLSQIIAQNKSFFNNNDIGGEDVFASAIVSDIGKNFQKPINELQREIDESGKKAMGHLRNIEIITGEISGLGLVDVLAIYTALWAIDIRYLIGFLDVRALKRLSDYFPQLKDNEIQTQLSGSRPTIVETLTEFEKILFNILTYADKLLVQTVKNPIQVRKGTIVN